MISAQDRDYLSTLRPGFRALAEFELHHPQIWEMQTNTTSVPYWFNLRFWIARVIADKVYGTQYLGKGLNGSGSETSPKLSARLAEGIRDIAHLATTLTQTRAEILALGTGQYRYVLDGKLINPLFDEFLSQSTPNHLLLEGMPIPTEELQYQRDVVAEADRVLTRPLGIAKRLTKIDDSERPTIEKLARLITDNLSDYLENDSHHHIVERSLGFAREAAATKKVGPSFLKALGVKTLLVEDAHYGRFANVSVIAKELGITVAAPQHGVITRQQEVYNYAPSTLAQSSLRRCLPDYLLTFGEHWGPQTSTTSQIVSIGRPDLIRTAKRVVTNTSTKDRPRLLFVSSKMNPDIYLDYCRSLESLAPNIDLVFRPHPSEVPRLSEIYGNYFTAPNAVFQLDEVPQALESVYNSDIVVGEQSAMLYEAQIFTNKTILVLNTPNTVGFLGDDIRYIGRYVTSAKDLLECTSNIEIAEPSKVQSHRFWNANWESAWDLFLEQSG